jgi:hypothetical protein
MVTLPQVNTAQIENLGNLIPKSDNLVQLSSLYKSYDIQVIGSSLLY